MAVLYTSVYIERFWSLNCKVKKFSKTEVFNEKIFFWSTKSSGNVREALISISNLVISVSGTDCDSFTRSSSLGLARFTIMGGLGLASSFRWDSEFEIGLFEFESNQNSTVWNCCYFQIFSERKFGNFHIGILVQEADPKQAGNLNFNKWVNQFETLFDLKY